MARNNICYLIDNRSFHAPFDPLGTISNDTFLSQYDKDNWIIEYNDCDSNECIIYVSSSGIYYPTTEDQFVCEIVHKNKYEWYKHRFKKIKKHIFIRDITKYFYFFGLNSKLNNIEKTIDFLKRETEGYQVTIIGSSGGGYFSCVLGAKLVAKRVFCFSGFFDLNSANSDNWPLLKQTEFYSEMSKWYRADELYASNTNTVVYYFYPTRNKEDVIQANVVKQNNHFKCYGIKNSIHGVCIGQFNLQLILNNSQIIDNVSSGLYSEIGFSYRLRRGHFFGCVVCWICEKIQKVFRKISRK